MTGLHRLRKKLLGPFFFEMQPGERRTFTWENNMCAVRLDKLWLSPASKVTVTDMHLVNASGDKVPCDLLVSSLDAGDAPPESDRLPINSGPGEVFSATFEAGDVAVDGEAWIGATILI